ncbi:MAG: hypothetical protein A2252_02280 [Elusimicrobia bacterium RIFOXYA2_FULL_39_19]|nr:MAG: hypothetical protein A2252_02280 [Elusimicrobia bacterium RIFOXYA2_FULL_39_19]
MNKTNNNFEKKRCLFGSFSIDTDIEAWFESISNWGVNRWVHFSPHYRGKNLMKGRLEGICRPEGTTIGLLDEHLKSLPFIIETNPEFVPYWKKEDSEFQEKQLIRAYNCCKKYNIDFFYGVPFPWFPVMEQDIIEKIYPELFDSEKMMHLEHPLLLEVMEKNIRSLHKALPELKGIEFWFAEGCAEAISFYEKDLLSNEKWLPGWLEVFEKTCRELSIEATVFAHHYLNTAETKKKSYEILSRFPGISVMEDITWPEENTLTPFLGYFTDDNKRNLFKNNPVELFFLLDTEYIGQGVLPCVLPRWLQHTVEAATVLGTKVLKGRVFFWDGASTDINFNRMNAYMFSHLVKNPEGNLKNIFKEAVYESAGRDIPDELINILWETEPYLKKIIGINGICPLDHSWFPSPVNIDKKYKLNDSQRSMKSVDDLFQAPGTICYPQYGGTLNAGKQWRWQNKTVSKPIQEYIDEKVEAVKWIEKVLPQVESLAVKLSKENAKLWIKGYKALLYLARGMKIFVELADLHYQWEHGRKSEKFKEMQNKAEELNNLIPAEELPLSLSKDMRAMSSFIKELKNGKN